MANIIKQLEAEQMLREVPEFGSGDTVVVQVKVKEGNRERLQAFEGVVIAKRNRGLNSSFTVRKISHGEGVERVFQTHSPLIAEIEVKRRGDVRRAKLYYMRERRGKAARIIDVLEIVNELREILYRVDVVMRWRRYQANARRGMAHPGNGLVDLVPRKLTALPRLRALGHLDLNLVCIDEILGADAEAPRGNLLDRRTRRVAIGERHEALGFLASLAAVGACAKAVHGNGERGVGFVGERPEGHRTGCESLDDGARGLDFLDGQRLVSQPQLEQSAQIHRPVAVLVDEPRVLEVLLEVVSAHCVLQQGNGLRRPHMLLAAQCATRVRHQRRAHPDGCWNSPKASRCRRTVSSAISARPTPSTGAGVPAKYSSTKALFKPTASKICAPQ